MEKITSYIQEHKDRFFKELFELLRIPSISPEPAHKEDMQKAAKALQQSLINAGVDKAEIYQTKGNPVLVAHKTINPKLPTIMVYGHYDVMPVDPLELWTNPPFEPVIKDGRIWARGANDDKGQLFMHVKAFEFMVRNNCLPCNVKFMLEGEEEIGSSSLIDFCKENKELLKADIILVSDTSMLGPDIPSITVGLRGLSYVQVEVTGPNKDLHSGLFGGAVANPAIILAQMINGLFDKQNRITIPGFYDDVLVIGNEERKEMAKAPFDEQAYMRALDVAELWGEEGYSTMERTGIRPSLDINGIWGGYTGEGTKTVLPGKAFAKISMRLVPNQNPQKIAELIGNYLQKMAPKNVKIKVDYLHGGEPYVCPVDNIAYKAANMALQKVYGKQAVPFRSGGSIPIIATFEKVLGIKSLLIGFGLEADAIHSPNESYSVENFLKGTETIPWVYKYYTEMLIK